MAGISFDRQLHGTSKHLILSCQRSVTYTSGSLIHCYLAYRAMYCIYSFHIQCEQARRIVTPTILGASKKCPSSIFFRIFFIALGDCTPHVDSTSNKILLGVAFLVSVLGSYELEVALYRRHTAPHVLVAAVVVANYDGTNETTYFKKQDTGRSRSIWDSQKREIQGYTPSRSRRQSTNSREFLFSVIKFSSQDQTWEVEFGSLREI